MNSTHDRRAAGLGLAGGVLGIAAGTAQAAAGETLGRWAGDKSDPVPLGVLTILLSAVALTTALTVKGSPNASAGRRAASVAGLAIPGLICFTTAGRLWWIPGVLLVAAAGLIILAAPAAVARAVADAWPAAVTGVLGASLALTAAGGSPPILVFGVLGGMAVAAAPWIAALNRPVALVILLLGTLPFAAVTWWTLLTPVNAILAIGTGIIAIRRSDRKQTPTDTGLVRLF